MRIVSFEIEYTFVCSKFCVRMTAYVWFCACQGCLYFPAVIRVYVVSLRDQQYPLHRNPLFIPTVL
jgi:hypothetical protein